MIKCDVKVCGTVSRAAEMRTNKNGESYMAFAMSVTIPAKNGNGKLIDISVSSNGDERDLASFVVGKRVEISGMLTFKKRGENIYFNLSASSANFTGVSGEDSIKGNMLFRGKTGKSIDERQDKKDKSYIQFSGFTTEKVNDSFEYLWVRFFSFTDKREGWLQPQTAIEVKGDLDLSVYNDKLNVSCKITEMSKYVKPQYNPNN